MGYAVVVVLHGVSFYWMKFACTWSHCQVFIEVTDWHQYVMCQNCKIVFLYLQIWGCNCEVTIDWDALCTVINILIPLMLTTVTINLKWTSYTDHERPQNSWRFWTCTQTPQYWDWWCCLGLSWPSAWEQTQDLQDKKQEKFLVLPLSPQRVRSSVGHCVSYQEETRPWPIQWQHKLKNGCPGQSHGSTMCHTWGKILAWGQCLHHWQSGHGKQENTQLCGWNNHPVCLHLATNI